MSTIALKRSTPFLMAALSAAWFFTFVSPARPFIWLAALLCVIGAALCARLPVYGSVCILLAGLVCSFAGVHYAEIEMLLPTMIVMFWLARSVSQVWVGFLFTLGYALLTAFRTDTTWYAPLTAAIVYGCAWLFGRLVRRRASAARTAAAESSRLAALDIDRIMQSGSQDEQQRLKAQSLNVVRGAIERMRALALHAGERLEPLAIDLIRQEGERAITSLHQILAKLRAAPRVNEMPNRQPTNHHVPRRHIFRIILVLSATVVCVTVASVAAPQNAGLFVLSTVIPTCAVAARRWPLSSAVVAAVAFLLTAVGAPFAPNILFPIGVCLAILIWNLIVAWSARATAAVFVVGSSAVLLGADYGKSGVGFVLTIIAISAFASHSWKEEDRILLDELTRGARLSADIAHTQVRMIRDERRRLAAELHDGISYAITAMTLQAQAALSLVHRDPAAARRALLAVQTVGAEALLEITDGLAGDSSPVDPSSQKTAAHALPGLIASARSRGVEVSVEGSLAHCREVLIFRIVQESFTNAARYAPGARLHVETGIEFNCHFVRVQNAPPPPDPSPSDISLDAQQPSKQGSGSGLRGLAARVHARGGSFDAGPVGEGFEVHARWPVQISHKPTDPVEMITQ